MKGVVESGSAIAAHFSPGSAMTIISTHHTSLKSPTPANTPGVVNAAAGFAKPRCSAYELRMGVPGASAGINMHSASD